MMMAAHVARMLLTAVGLWTTASSVLLAGSGNKKQPVPSDEAQAKAMKIVKEVYGAEYAKAISVEAKQALAKTLLDEGKKMQDDLPGRFVLLKSSREIATQALDGLTAFQAVDAISETFEVDPAEMKAAVLKHGAAHATTNQQHKRLMEVALPLVDVAVTEDNYTVAKQLCDFAATEATAANESQVRSHAITRGADVDKVLAVLYEKAQSAAPMLNADPVNPAANAAYGKYLCFVKRDWDRGVLMLALGSDPSLKAVAQKELEELSPTQPDQLGDEWWDSVDKEDGVIKSQGQARAAYWYRKALPGLAGLRKEQITKRLDSLAKEPSPSAVATNLAPKENVLGEHAEWTVPYFWTEQVQRFETVNEFNPQSGQMKQYKRPFMATVHKHGTKTVKAKLVNYDYKAGNVVLKIFDEDKKIEVVRTFKYVALGKDDKKFLDSVRKQLIGQ
jgi:hypothetical protein